MEKIAKSQAKNHKIKTEFYADCTLGKDMM